MSTVPKRVKFSYNWNNKLDCKAFTTIRLHNAEKYIVGEVYEIYLKDKDKWIFKGRARLESKRTFLTEKINQFVAYLDTGYSAQQTKTIIRKMYKQHNPEVDFCLFVKVK